MFTGTAEGVHSVPGDELPLRLAAYAALIKAGLRRDDASVASRIIERVARERRDTWIRALVGARADPQVLARDLGLPLATVQRIVRAGSEARAIPRVDPRRP